MQFLCLAISQLIFPPLQSNVAPNTVAERAVATLVVLASLAIFTQIIGDFTCALLRALASAAACTFFFRSVQPSSFDRVAPLALKLPTVMTLTGAASFWRKMRFELPTLLALASPLQIHGFDSTAQRRSPCCAALFGRLGNAESLGALPANDC